MDRVLFTPAFRQDDAVVIGLWLAEHRNDFADLAVELGRSALEKRIEVVALSRLDYSGPELFGVRCERITGGTAEAHAACERQVAAFWNQEVVI